MSYAQTFAAAKHQAREILRAQMAGRVQGRVSRAKEALTAGILLLTKQLAAWKEADKKQEKHAAEAAKIRDAIRETLDTLSPEDRALAAEALGEADEDEAKEAERKAADTEKMRAAETKRLEEDVTTLRTEYERLLKVQQEVEDGTQKVNLEEMLALANRLIEEGRVTEVADF